MTAPVPVPVGTPGRDPNMMLPPPAAPGAPLPPRKGGPGARTMVLVVTVVGCLALAVAGGVAVVGGTVNNLISTGRVVLKPGQYRATTSGSCAGGNGLAVAKVGATVDFASPKGDRFSAAIRSAALRSGSCYLTFRVRSFTATDAVYTTRIGPGRMTPVTGAEIRSGNFDLYPVS